MEKEKDLQKKINQYYSKVYNQVLNLDIVGIKSNKWG